jgi:CheY-like chemotaxis protein
VLVVEDEALVRLVVIELLESLGFRAEEAATAGEAVDKLTREPVSPAAVIIDIGLPDRRGDALAGELRAMDPDLGLVIASGYGEEGLDAELRADAKVAFLPKPYDIRQLWLRLQAVGARAPNDP